MRRHDGRPWSESAGLWGHATYYPPLYLTLLSHLQSDSDLRLLAVWAIALLLWERKKEKRRENGEGGWGGWCGAEVWEGKVTELIRKMVWSGSETGFVCLVPTKQKWLELSAQCCCFCLLRMFCFVLLLLFVSSSFFLFCFDFVLFFVNLLFFLTPTCFLTVEEELETIPKATLS